MISVPVQAHEGAPAGRQKSVALGARDAGLDMVIGELTTARDLNLPVIVIDFAGASLAPIEMKQRAVTYADTAVGFPGTDYAKVARALSGNGYVCRSREQLKSALTQALTTERFSVICYEFPGGAYDGRICVDTACCRNHHEARRGR